MMYTVVGYILLDTLHLHYAGTLVLKTEHTHYDSHVIWSWSQILFMKFTHLWCRENSVPFFCSLGKSWNASCALPGRLCSTPSRSTLLGAGHRQQEGRSGTSVCLVVCPTCRHTRHSWEHWKPLQLWYGMRIALQIIMPRATRRWLQTLTFCFQTPSRHFVEFSQVIVC